MGAPAQPVESAEQLEAARAEHDVLAVGFFRDPDSVSAIIYLRVADAVHDYPFFLVADPELFKQYEVEDDAVVVFKQFDEGRADFPAADYVADDLMNFLRLETFPLVSELNIDNVWRVTEEANFIKTHFLVFRNASDPRTPSDIEGLVLPVAQKHKGSVLFLLVDMADRRMFHMEEFFGVQRDRTPAMRIFRYEGPTFKFRPQHDGTISTEQVLQFCDDFLTGKLKAFQLQQPLPEDWDAAPVKVLTAQNYADVTLDPTHHVFVMLHAPWCPHCQLVGPIFDQLAELYLPHSDVITLARMDATANEVEGLEFQSFPTFFLYAVDGQRHQFNGSRTLEDFVEFLNEYTTVNLDFGSADGETHADKTCGESEADGGDICTADVGGGGDTGAAAEDGSAGDKADADAEDASAGDTRGSDEAGAPLQSQTKDEL
ncbi:protein disulfide-isomerase-like [Pollicipes pollicipes]|uniref:protein disulfide-isomerase-like n=1 Tax=Pollicipes pollicipes TaxID=41117 RepID=UPI001884DB6C|nr:protein disulfide-isomerase-like [Pollicipes pollicipes]